MTRVNFHLTDAQRDRLKSESDRTGLSVAELIRRAVDTAMAKATRAHNERLWKEHKRMLRAKP